MRKYAERALLLLALVGCANDPTPSEAPPAPVAFAPVAPVAGASVALRGRPDPSAPNHVVVDVVARGAPDVHGVAFRIRWNADALTYADANIGPVWSKSALAMAKATSPGQLVVAWAEKGEKGIDASSETVLGTLVFDMTGKSGSTLSFQTERAQLIDRKGAHVAARWLDGAVIGR